MKRALLSPFSALLRHWRIFLCDWALSQLSPTDPRVPEIVLERAEIERRA